MSQKLWGNKLSTAVGSKSTVGGLGQGLETHTPLSPISFCIWNSNFCELFLCLQFCSWWTATFVQCSALKLSLFAKLHLMLLHKLWLIFIVWLDSQMALSYCLIFHLSNAPVLFFTFIWEKLHKIFLYNQILATVCLVCICTGSSASAKYNLSVCLQASLNLVAAWKHALVWIFADE